MDNAWFGEVRSASAPEAEASAEQWLPDVMGEVARRWPLEVRHASLDWLKRVAAGDKPAAWPLIWRIWMRGAGVGRAVVERFVEQDALKHAAWIDAGVMELGAADVARLMDGLTGARVDVSLTHNKLGEGRAWRWLEHPRVAKIGMLELRDSGLAQAPWLARLETFRINDLWGDGALDALFDSPYLEDSQLRWQLDKMAPTDHW